MGGALSLGGSAASMATTAGCCACSSAMSGCNQAGKASKRGAAMVYVLFVFLASLLAVIMKTYGTDLILHTPGGDVGCTADWCHGNESVYRVSFGLVLFFCVCLIVAPFCEAFHLGMWGVKCLLLPVAIAGAYAVPAPFYMSFEDVARVASSLFLFLQVLILIEFAYDTHEWLVVKADEADEGQEPGLCSNWYRISYICLCVVLLLASVVGCCVMYSYFSCGAGPASISVTLLAVIVFTAVSVSEYGQGLLVGAVMATYVTWLEFSAMTSMPSEDPTCNPFAQHVGGDSASVWMGIVFAAVSIGYAGFSAATGTEHLFDEPPVRAPLADADGRGDDDGAASPTPAARDARTYRALAEGKTDADSSREELRREREADMEAGLEPGGGGGGGGRRKSWVEGARGAASNAGNIALFHFIMVCCGFYMAMVLTNWADTPDSNDPKNMAGTSTTAMWVKLISQYVTIVLFVWSVVAPHLFPESFARTA